MTTEMWRDLGRALDEVAYDPGILVMIVTGAGADFCAGADVTGMPGNDPRVHPLSRMQLVNRSVLALHHLPVPTIARVDGVAVGAGCNLALGCDLVIASDRARFSEIFMRRAMSVDGGGSWLLPRLIGLQRAKELCFLADIISAQDAARIGLVSRVVPAADLERTVDELAGRLAAAPVPLENRIRQVTWRSSVLRRRGCTRCSGRAGQVFGFVRWPAVPPGPPTTATSPGERGPPEEACSRR